MSGPTCVPKVDTFSAQAQSLRDSVSRWLGSKDVTIARERWSDGAISLIVAGDLARLLRFLCRRMKNSPTCLGTLLLMKQVPNRF
jgi:hypothetical protein